MITYAMDDSEHEHFISNLTMTNTCVQLIREQAVKMFRKYPFIVADYYLYHYFSDYIYFKFKNKPSFETVKTRLKRLYEIFICIHSKIVRIIQFETEFHLLFGGFLFSDNIEYQHLVMYVVNVIHETYCNPRFNVSDITNDDIRDIMQDYM